MSKLQPMDQGVIRLLQSLLQSFSIAKTGRGYQFKRNENARSCIASENLHYRCFTNAGILKDQQKSAQSGDDDPFRDLQNQIEKLGEFYPPGTTAEDVVSADENVVCIVPLLTDEELIEEMNNENGDDVDNGEDDDDDAQSNPVYHKVSDIREALQVLHDCMPFSLSGEDIRQKFNAVSISIDRGVTAKMTRSDIRTFFQ